MRAALLERAKEARHQAEGRLADAVAKGKTALRERRADRSHAPVNERLKEQHAHLSSLSAAFSALASSMKGNRPCSIWSFVCFRLLFFLVAFLTVGGLVGGGIIFK